MAFKDKQKMLNYINDFNKNNYRRFVLMASKEDGAKIDEEIKRNGKSRNAYILGAVSRSLLEQPKWKIGGLSRRRALLR